MCQSSGVYIKMSTERRECVAVLPSILGGSRSQRPPTLHNKPHHCCSSSVTGRASAQPPHSLTERSLLRQQQTLIRK